MARWEPPTQAFANALLRSLDPELPALAFDATKGFETFSDEPAFVGSWKGRVEVDGQALRCILTFEVGGRITIEFPDRAPSEALATKSSFSGLINGDLLITTFAGALPAREVAQQPGGEAVLAKARRETRRLITLVAPGDRGIGSQPRRVIQ